MVTLLLALVAGVQRADAAVSFTALVPSPGETITVPAHVVGLNAQDPAGLPGYVGMAVDGSRERVNVTQSSQSQLRIVSQRPRYMKNGIHTATATVYDAAFAPHTKTWSFVVDVPTVISGHTPANGASVSTVLPQIAVNITSNGSFTSMLTVDGDIVPTVWDFFGSRLSGRCLIPLDPTQTHTAILTLRDTATGRITSSLWEFSVDAPSPLMFSDESPARSGVTSAADVAPEAVAEGAIPSRVRMQVDGTEVPASFSAVAGRPGAYGVRGSSLRLSDGAHAVALQIIDTEGRLAKTQWDFTVSSPPVIGSINPPDASTITTTGVKFTALISDNDGVGTVGATIDTTVTVGDVTYDAGSGTATFKATMQGDSSLHTLDITATDTGGLQTTERVTFRVEPAPVPTPPCTSCHVDYDIGLHRFANCDACHSEGAKVTNIAHNWSGCNKVCHSRVRILDCRTGGCHVYTQDTHRANVFVENPDGRVWSCATDCHTDKATGHGFGSGRGHTSSETCLAVCHDVDLKTEHTASAPSLLCETCHQARPAVWNGDCAGCHATANHTSAALSHVGTDAKAKLVRRRGQGCSNTSLAPNWGCHDLSDTAALHAGMPNKGCDLCHGVGRAPAAECKTCHTVGGTVGYASTLTLYPAEDGTATVPLTVVPVTPATRWDKVDEPTANTTDYVDTTGGGVHMYRSGPITSFPASTTITDVRVLYRALYVNAATAVVPAAAPALTVGGVTYGKPLQNLTTAYLDYGTVAASIFTTNPATGQAWTPDEVRGIGHNSLTEFGVEVNNAAPRTARFTQVYLTVNYAVSQYVAPRATTDRYHHNNNAYLLDPADAVQEYFYPGNYPPGGWSAIYYQRCNDGCHRSFVGPTWSAFAGTAMWYSLAGQTQGISETRTLTLDGGVLPDAAAVTFKTRWQFQTTGNATGTVELSTNGGGSWAPLTGLVHGRERSVLATNSPASWGDASYDLSSYAGQSALLRFRYNLAGNNTGAGWAIDNVALSGSSGVVFGDDAEALKPQWTAVQWVREKNAFTKY